METIEIPEPDQAEAPATKRNRIIDVVVGACIAVALIIGGITIGIPIYNSVQTAAHNAALAKAQSEVPASPLGDGTTSTEQGTLAQSDAAGAQLVVAENAKLVAQAAAAAAAAAQAAKEAALHKADDSTGGWAPGEAPAGTPVPFIPSSDPNNAAGGSYEDPGLFCASHSASTVNGVPVCD